MMTGVKQFHVASDAGIVRDVIVQQPIGPSRQNGTAARGGATSDAAIVQFEALVAALENAGITVFRFDELLAETLKFADARDWLLERRVADHGFAVPVRDAILAWLNDLPRTQLAACLTQGMSASRLPLAIRDKLGDIGFQLLPALPEMARLRHFARWIGGGVVLGAGTGGQGRAVSVNMSAVLHFSPLFDEAHFEFWLASDGSDAQWPPIDGHDVAMLGPSTFLAAVTGNTTTDALRRLAAALHRRGVATQMLCLDLRQTRCRSLDDCFVLLDRDLALVDRSAIEAAPAFLIRSGLRPGVCSLTSCPDPVLEQLAGMVKPLRLRIVDTSQAADAAARSALSALHPLVLSPGRVLAFAEHAAAFAELERSGIEIAVAVRGDALCAAGCGPRSLVSVVSAH